MKRSGFAVMARLVGLVRPLAGYMALAVTMGLAGHLCATFLTVFGGFGILQVLGFAGPLPLAGLFGAAAFMAVLRAVLRYGEQACNHFILLPSNCWHCCGTGCSAPCAVWPPPSWKAGTKGT